MVPLAAAAKHLREVGAHLPELSRGGLPPVTSTVRSAIGPLRDCFMFVLRQPSDGDDDLAAGATFLDVADGGRGLAERVGPVDGGGDLS